MFPVEHEAIAHRFSNIVMIIREYSPLRLASHGWSRT
jgi:hypothetical protein